MVSCWRLATRDWRLTMTPRWLTWLFLIALGYMVYSVGEQHRATPVTAEQPAVAQEQSTAAIAEFTDTEAWKRRLNPDYAATHDCTVTAPKGANPAPLLITEPATGDGSPAACGDSIPLALTIWDSKGTVRFDGKLTLALGSRDLASGLDKGLVGIKSGGVRMLVLPAYARVHAKSKPAQSAIIAARTALAGNGVVIVRATRIRE